MPEITATFADIHPYLEAEQLPEQALKRMADTVWRARLQPTTEVDKTQPVWSLVRAGDLVRIPLIPYRAPTTDPAGLVLAAVEQGIRCAIDMPRAIRVHLVIGKPVEDLQPEADALRFWLGVAVQEA